MPIPNATSAINLNYIYYYLILQTFPFFFFYFIPLLYSAPTVRKNGILCCITISNRRYSTQSSSIFLCNFFLHSFGLCKYIKHSGNEHNLHIKNSKSNKNKLVVKNYICILAYEKRMWVILEKKFCKARML